VIIILYDNQIYCDGKFRRNTRIENNHIHSDLSEINYSKKEYKINWVKNDIVYYDIGNEERVYKLLFKLRGLM